MLILVVKIFIQLNLISYQSYLRYFQTATLLCPIIDKKKSSYDDEIRKNKL
jgi:hypothetical protein